jgi:hypothetical protein
MNGTTNADRDEKKKKYIIPATTMNTNKKPDQT